MATIAQNVAGLTHPSRGGNDIIVPTTRFIVLDWAAVLAKKGSALAAADVVQAITIPAGSQVIGAGAYVKTGSNATTHTIGVGYSGATSNWCAALSTLTAGVFGTDVNPTTAATTFTSASTIDVIFTTLTGTLSTGKLMVWATILNVADRNASPGLAALGS